jgi:hypothetical protein
MAATNENLILQVFNEMLKVKPGLQKMLVTEDEEETEKLDPRILGDIVIRNFPWPIGVELRRLFSASMRQPDRMRLDQIFKTIERVMQFMSFVMIAQLWKEKVIKKIEVPDSFSREFQSRMLVLSMGNYSWLIRSIGNLYQQNKIQWFMPEMGANFDGKFYAALDFWVPERNEIGHYQINLTQEEIERRCVEYEEKLTLILQKISFLAKYKLVSIRDIKVIHPRNYPARFNHTIDLLNSSDSDFKVQELIDPVYAESNSVLIMKTIKVIEEYLNLSPLVIDTNPEVIDNKEKLEIKKDIFMYSKYREGHMMYVGTEVTEKCDLRSLSNYQILVEQFKDLMKVIADVEI